MKYDYLVFLLHIRFFITPSNQVLSASKCKELLTKILRPDAVRRSLRNRNYKTGEICRQKGRSTNINCSNTPTHYQLNSVTDRRFKRELQKGTRQIKDTIVEKTKERWRGKKIHGLFPHKLDEKLVDTEQSYRWLKFGDIKGEPESAIMAAQDKAISTNCFKNKILKEELTVMAIT